jgi:hypothetical protein
VAKVDHVLRSELEIADGLADPRVVVLDPCCGTGAYLVEVLHRIEGTLRERGDDALVASDVKRAARERVFGFEIMPAPFVVAHLQLGLVMQQMEAPFGEDERAGIYLTNALTGWTPPEEPKDQIPIALPELETEREQAAHVKRDEPILVILGNPPYSGYAGMAIGEERDLTDAYRTTKRAPKPQGQGLNDLYVRFFRMAERKILEMEPRRGIVCFISNYSWLDGLSFTGMRERYLQKFDRIWIDNLHGDRIISEYAPDGRTSETVFAMEGSSVGIRIGTAISTLAVTKEGASEGEAGILYRDFHQARAAVRRAALLSSIDAPDDPAFGYEAIAPDVELGLPFKPKVVAEGYLDWPRLSELFPLSFPGVLTGRDAGLVSIDREPLETLITDYFDANVPHEEIANRVPKLMKVTARFRPVEVRETLQARGQGPGSFRRYAYRPFDLRWLYWDPDTKLLDEKRSEFEELLEVDNTLVASQTRSRRQWSPPQVTAGFGDYVLADPSTSYTPLVRRTLSSAGELDLAPSADPRRIDATRSYNLSARAVEYLTAIGSVREDASNLFRHAIAVMHARAYREENAGALRQDWPRIPLPETREQLVASADLGRQLAALLNPETEVPGVTTREIRPELRVIGSVQKIDGGQLDPHAGDLAVTAGWGYAGARGVTMPGRGRAEERQYTDAEREALAAGAARIGLSADDALALLGGTCYDVYLNDVAFWRCVPSRVWEYTLGGYQVIKKWLSYREQPLLGRALKPEEVREVTNIARRIAGILLMERELDAGYREVREDPGNDAGMLGRDIGTGDD